MAPNQELMEIDDAIVSLINRFILTDVTARFSFAGIFYEIKITLQGEFNQFIRGSKKTR